MQNKFASAYPRKRFFLEMFTRDISLEDCILDLIDNSIDALVRLQNIDLSSKVLALDTDLTDSQKKRLPKITITYSPNGFTIEDNCGGISRKDAEEDIFNFGHDDKHSGQGSGRQLGAYGVGLKRALFKIGEEFFMTSQTTENGFSTKLNVIDWAKDDQKLTDWQIPIKFIGGASSDRMAGTKIVIGKLRKETKILFEDLNFSNRLEKAIGQTYSLFLERFVRVKLEKNVVAPQEIPLGGHQDMELSNENFETDGVTVYLIAGLAEGGTKGFQAEKAGWYVLCNGRVVVSANKSDLTGWGGGILPNFHSKHRGFIGIAMFNSKDPLKLPWTTTKRSLNRESPIYQRARNKMGSVARPVIQYLDGLYADEIEKTPTGRKLAEDNRKADIRKAASKPESVFRIKKVKPNAPPTQQVKYVAKKSDLEKIRKHLRKPSLTAPAIGEHTFQYFLNAEGLE